MGIIDNFNPDIDGVDGWVTVFVCPLKYIGAGLMHFDWIPR